MKAKEKAQETRGLARSKGSPSLYKVWPKKKEYILTNIQSILWYVYNTTRQGLCMTVFHDISIDFLNTVTYGKIKV